MSADKSYRYGIMAKGEINSARVEGTAVSPDLNTYGDVARCPGGKLIGMDVSSFAL
ncbi:MAG: hypothetical protein R2865_01105 [Deinococcales bacterium]